ncbi:MAG: FeoA domain-containing protein [Coriobacteriales bacterium]|jgi:Fe2+ transport system protein FeoA|nr:FeoA domain-containing protein [Coriobacteriales bacterium]
MVRVISENDGALIVEVKNSRLALGHDMAGCLTVM